MVSNVFLRTAPPPTTAATATPPANNGDNPDVKLLSALKTPPDPVITLDISANIVMALLIPRHTLPRIPAIGEIAATNNPIVTIVCWLSLSKLLNLSTHSPIFSTIVKTVGNNFSPIEIAISEILLFMASI